MSLLLDIGVLNEFQTDDALEFIYKAIGDDGSTDAIFDQHPSPFIRRLVELFYDRGLMQLEGFRKELDAWLEGSRHQPSPLPARPDGNMIRWTPAELQLVKLYLTALPPAQFTLDDHMLLVDYLFQRYLPADHMRAESEWLATRATLMGRVQANMESLSAGQADKVLAALPITVVAARQTFPFTTLQNAVIDYAAAHAAENVRAFADTARHRLRAAILQATEEKLLAGPNERIPALQTRLLDEFATLNRDWRRIAVTESTENANQGYVASLPEGDRVQRVEQYRGACPFCRKIDGKIMTVVAADKPNKNGATEIWVGKTNIGRSAAPRKRVGNELVEREPHERWWTPAGAVHPNCRGRFIPTVKQRPTDDPEFAQWLGAVLGGGHAKLGT